MQAERACRDLCNPGLGLYRASGCSDSGHDDLSRRASDRMDLDRRRLQPGFEPDQVQPRDEGQGRAVSWTRGNAASFATSIAALNIALAGVGTTQTDLNGGPYYQYSTASGEVANPNFDSRIHFTPSVHDSLQAGDARASKIVKPRSTAATLTVDGTAYSTLYDPAVAVTSNSANQTRPVAILRNAELYALRAQAEVGAGNLPAATTDINVLRVTEGGLAPYATFTSATQAINAILYEKRYSFLVEGPQRLVDLRAYNRLNATSFPKNNKITSFYATDPYNYVLPYTQAELDARGGHITCQ